MRSTPVHTPIDTIGDVSSSAASTTHSSSVTFAALGLSPQLCEALQRAGYIHPTPIQKAAIALCIQGRDVLGFAQTGTGKTAAFALPILHRLMSKPSPHAHKAPVIRALVLSPTRELAAQIGASFGKYSRGANGQSLLRHTVVYGGVGKGPQAQTVRRGVDILVATPGRLLDLMRDGAADLKHVEVLVLDEADRMLSMGFIRDVMRIIHTLPVDRQTMLFSATTSPEIQHLAKSTMQAPTHVAVDPVTSPAAPIHQSVYFVERNDKLAMLIHLLNDRAVESALVFTRTKHVANRVAEKLERIGVRAAAIHGNKSQGARERALQGLKSGHVRVLVATDIAARGIHVQGLSHVINFEIPNEPESYIHRIGRTGRAGATGCAIALCAPDERGFFRSVERLIGKTIERRDKPTDLKAIAQAGSMTSAAEMSTSAAMRQGDRSDRPRQTGQTEGTERRARPDRTPRADAPRPHREAPRHRDDSPRREDPRRREASPHHREDPRRRDGSPHRDESSPRRDEPTRRSHHQPNQPHPRTERSSARPGQRPTSTRPHARADRPANTAHGRRR